MNLTVRDVAKLLNHSEKTIYRWITDGILPAYRINNQYRFNKAELLEWATAKKINIAQDLFAEAESSATPLPLLSQAVEDGGIHYRVGGTARDAVLESVVSLLRVPDDVDRAFLLRILLARENIGSTGVGEGIALPHVRNPIVLGVARAAVTLCFLETPVDYGAVDGRPVHTLFTLISPTVRVHLHLLSRLAFALRDAAFKDILIRQGTREEILADLRRIEAGLAAPPAPEPGGEKKASGRFFL